VHDRRSEAPTTWDSPTAPTLRHNDDMREVVDGVIEVPIGYVNAYVVVVDDGVVLGGHWDSRAGRQGGTCHRGRTAPDW
jgi:hypothetical protein